MPIRERIALFAALVVAATVLIFSVFIYGLSDQALHRARDGTLSTRCATTTSRSTRAHAKRRAATGRSTSPRSSSTCCIT